MDAIEQNRTFLFADEIQGGSRTPPTGCRTTRQNQPADEIILENGFGPVLGSAGGREPIQIGFDTEDSNDGLPAMPVPAPGSVLLPTSPHIDMDVLTYPDFKLRNILSWDGQNFVAYSTPWEQNLSPLALEQPHDSIKFMPVVDECGTVVGYQLKGGSSDDLWAREDGAIFYDNATSVTGARRLGSTTIYLAAGDQAVAWVDSAAESLTTEELAALYETEIPYGNKCNVLVDPYGLILSLEMYDEDLNWDKNFASPDGIDAILFALIDLVEGRPENCGIGFDPLTDIQQHPECEPSGAKVAVWVFLMLSTFKTQGGSNRGSGKKSSNKNGKLSIRRSNRGGSRPPGLAFRMKRSGGRVVVRAPMKGGKRAKLVLKAGTSGKKANLSPISRKIGMTNMAVRDIRAKMEKLGVRVRFRPAGVARKLRKRGAVPKWEELKMKTINDDDIALGAPKEGKGKPGYFQPKEPDPSVKKSDPDRYERLMKRYQQRQTEFKEMAPKVKKYVEDGDIIVKDGVVYEGKTGKDIAGDYDIYEILDNKGQRITPNDARYEKILKDLSGRRIQAMHGAHVDWNPTDPFEIKIKEEIIQRHRTTEPLYEFREDGSIWETFAD